MSVRRHAIKRVHFGVARAGVSDRESPDGVVGVPAGGDRRAWSPRASPGHSAGARRPRSRGAQPSAQRHRPAQPPVDGRNRRGGKGCRRGAGSPRVRLRQRHDGMDVGDGAFDGPRRPRDQGRRQPALASRRRTRPRLAGRTSGHRAGRILRRSIWFPRFTRQRPAAIQVGYPVRSAGRCTPSSRGWCTNPIRSSRVRHR